MILQKYNYTLPKVFEQKINKAVKAIGALLKMNEQVIIEEMKGGFKVKKNSSLFVEASASIFYFN